VEGHVLSARVRPSLTSSKATAPDRGHDRRIVSGLYPADGAASPVPSFPRCPQPLGLCPVEVASAAASIERHVGVAPGVAGIVVELDRLLARLATAVTRPAVVGQLGEKSLAARADRLAGLESLRKPRNATRCRDRDLACRRRVPSVSAPDRSRLRSRSPRRARCDAPTRVTSRRTPLVIGDGGADAASLRGRLQHPAHTPGRPDRAEPSVLSRAGAPRVGPRPGPTASAPSVNRRRARTSRTRVPPEGKVRECLCQR
jgi:hypothetical protein